MKIKTVSCKPSTVNQIKHPTTVTPLKKASTLINDNGKSVSKGKVQPRTTKKQQWSSKKSSWVLGGGTIATMYLIALLSLLVFKALHEEVRRILQEMKI